MLKVALTGGIATGKTHVIRRLQERGVACLDADELAHGVMASGTEATALIAERFGDVLAADGSVDREKLGPIVFADPSARRELEAIVHPAVYRAIAAAVRGFERIGGIPLVVVDIPLLYETGHAAEFPIVVATVCPKDTQIARLLQRGLSREAAEQRIAAQIPAEEKAGLANYVIRTDGTVEDTDAQVRSVLDDLLARARA
ncbi:MAG: dephospho-CoA kinase [Vicinamibacterales bacterium]